MVPTTPRLTRYDDARAEIRTGDLLLFRGRGLIARAIGIAGRGAYSHAAMAVWIRPADRRDSGLDRLMCAEVREWHGGRLVTLSSQVKVYPGQIDVYETNVGIAQNWRFDSLVAAGAMLDFAGTRYGYWSVLRASLSHLAVARLFNSVNTDDQARDDQPPFCSAAIALACRAGGVDPVVNLADGWTEPNDLARSPFFDYRFTLIAEDALPCAS